MDLAFNIFLRLDFELVRGRFRLFQNADLGFLTLAHIFGHNAFGLFFQLSEFLVVGRQFLFGLGFLGFQIAQLIFNPFNPGPKRLGQRLAQKKEQPARQNDEMQQTVSVG